MRMLRLIVTSIFLVLAASLTFAAKVEHLYQAKVPVTAQTAAERVGAIRQGLQDVLVRVSGNSAVLTLPELQDSVKQADKFLDGYSYQTDPQSGDLSVVLNFSPAAIKGILRELHQAMWGSERPLLVVWVSEKQDARVDSSALSIDGLLRAQVQEWAERRGIPVIFPVMDLTDISHNWLTEDGQLSPQLRAELQRYHADGVLQVDFIQGNNLQWQSQWQLLSPSQQLRWQFSGNHSQALAKQGMNAVADSLAAQYAVLENVDAPNAVDIRVSNVSSLPIYAKVMQYLKKLGPVSEVEVVDVSKDSVLFRLLLLSDKAGLAQAMRFQPMLKPQTQPNNQQDSVLHYRYQT